jgi:hypothetical protein
MTAHDEALQQGTLSAGQPARELLLRARSVAVVLALAICATACGPSDADFSELAAYESPDGARTVIVHSAHSVMAYGPEVIRVYVSDGDRRERTHVVTTKIANDGVGISRENLGVEWVRSDVVKFCLTGVEQEDRILEINIETFSNREWLEKCSK